MSHCTCVPWLIQMCDMTHSWVCHEEVTTYHIAHVCHDSFKCVPWLIHECAMRKLLHITFANMISCSLCRDTWYHTATHFFFFSWWVLQHCTGFARLVWGRLRVHRAFIYSNWFKNINNMEWCIHIKEHYGLATISRRLQMIGLFCRISSLLQGSFAKESYNLKEPTNFMKRI